MIDMMDSATYRETIEKGKKIGWEHGEKVLRSLIETKFGAMPPGMLERIERLTASDLDAFGRELLSEGSISDLEEWLRAHAPSAN